MNREEAHKLWHKDSWQLAGRDYHKFVDTIFDELESRTCENCKNNLENTGKQKGCTAIEISPKDMTKDFGCSKFIRKD